MLLFSIACFCCLVLVICFAKPFAGAVMFGFLPTSASNSLTLIPLLAKFYLISSKFWFWLSLIYIRPVPVHVPFMRSSSSLTWMTWRAPDSFLTVRLSELVGNPLSWMSTTRTLPTSAVGCESLAVIKLLLLYSIVCLASLVPAWPLVAKFLAFSAF